MDYVTKICEIIIPIAGYICLLLVLNMEPPFRNSFRKFWWIHISILLTNILISLILKQCIFEKEILKRIVGISLMIYFIHFWICLRE
jgi:hypothetical protein